MAANLALKMYLFKFLCYSLMWHINIGVFNHADFISDLKFVISLNIRDLDGYYDNTTVLM